MIIYGTVVSRTIIVGLVLSQRRQLELSGLNTIFEM